VTLSLDGGGIVQLSGANTYSGGTTLANGTTVRINNATALGTGTFTINGGTIDNTNPTGRSRSPTITRKRGTAISLSPAHEA
jgi:autotransporter-associated beta strand protein